MLWCFVKILAHGDISMLSFTRKIQLFVKPRTLNIKGTGIVSIHLVQKELFVEKKEIKMKW